MKKIIFSLVLMFSASIVGVAEDIIYLMNGSLQRVSVVEVNTIEIKYIKMENPQGPVYVIPRSEVHMIEYNNGYKEYITSIQNNSSQCNSGHNNDTYINNYYTQPRPQVYVNVLPPPAPVCVRAYPRPRYGYHHGGRYNRRPGCGW